MMEEQKLLNVNSVIVIIIQLEIHVIKEFNLWKFKIVKKIKKIKIDVKLVSLIMLLVVMD